MGIAACEVAGVGTVVGVDNGRVAVAGKHAVPTAARNTGTHSLGEFIAEVFTFYLEPDPAFDKQFTPIQCRRNEPPWPAARKDGGACMRRCPAPWIE